MWKYIKKNLHHFSVNRGEKLLPTERGLVNEVLTKKGRTEEKSERKWVYSNSTAGTNKFVDGPSCVELGLSGGGCAQHNMFLFCLVSILFLYDALRVSTFKKHDFLCTHAWPSQKRPSEAPGSQSSLESILHISPGGLFCFWMQPFVPGTKSGSSLRMFNLPSHSKRLQWDNTCSLKVRFSVQSRYCRNNRRKGLSAMLLAQFCKLNCFLY